MDSPLCSLSHTTTPKNTHTSHGIHVDVAADEDEDDMANNNNAATTDDSLDGEDAPAINLSPMEFQFADFIVLANRVIDKGDDESVRALNDLHSLDSEIWRRRQEFAGAAAEHPPCLAPSLQISENKAAADLNLRVSMAPLEARDEATTPLMIENQQPLLQVSSDHPPMMLPELPTADVVSVDAAPVHVTADVTSLPTSSPTGIFVGNVPLQPCLNFMNYHDKIANIFHNSSRKILTYVPPMMQTGEIIVRPTLDMVRDGSRRWNATPVGYFLGKRPYFHHVKDYVKSIWPLLAEVTATTNGFFFFRFKTIVAMEEVIEGGPWLFQGQPIMLQKWEPGMVLRKLKHTQVPVWVKLRHLPVELWTNDGLSTVASGIERPLYPDAITRACTRLDFAHVCVMLDINAELPKHLVIMSPTEEGGEIACKVDVEYEWLPPKCTTCMSLGHATKDCPSMKVPKPPVNVYVQKARVQPPIAESGKAVEEDKNNSLPLSHKESTIIDDKIAHAFNHSSQKTLKFIAPTLQNGEVIVRPTLDTIRNGSKRWKTTVVGYFLGKRPYFHHLKEYALSVWPGLREVTGTTNGFFFFQFKLVADMEDIIEGGSWLFQGQPIVLQKWESGMVLRKLKHTQVLVWVKLRHLPVELWTEEGLSIVASGVGKPLYPDAITRACTRLDFARVCVMLDAKGYAIVYIMHVY
ncbi:UNVERIFIED_CONTAM: hypothetical protein Sindi_0948200 [Sesamum indicum]